MQAAEMVRARGSASPRGLGTLFPSLPFQGVEARAGLVNALGTDAAEVPLQAHQRGGVERVRHP